jgi:uncharacterized protein YkwD
MRAASRCIVLSLSTALLSVALLAVQLPGASAATAATTREAALLSKINHARAVHGLPPVRANASLMTYAHSHAAAMAASRQLFHTSNFSVVCCWSAIGENIGRDWTIKRVHRALMRSPGHRANILDARMRRVGVGVVERYGQLWVTEVFSKPA